MRITQLLVGTVPRGPEPPDMPTPESIASAHEFNAEQRARVALQGVVFADLDGAGALVAALRSAL